MGEQVEKTVDLQGVPIFSTGIWEGNGSAKGGDAFSEKDLDEIVDSFKKVGDKVKPRLILGHDKEKSKDFSGYPSLGWITDLKREGGDLLADIKKVPKKVKELIDKKAYGRFSPGIWKRMNVNGKDHYKVMDHLALLGGTLPANMGLDGFIDLYEFENNDDLVCYYNKTRTAMENENLQAEITGLSNKIKELQGVLDSKDSKVEELEKENEELKANFQKAEKDAKESEVKSMLDKAAESGKITPAQMPLFMALAMNDDNVMTYEYKDGDKSENIQGDKIELVKKIIDNSASVSFSEESVNGETSNQAYSKKEVKDEEDEFNEKVLQHAKDNKISYSDAWDALIREV